MALRHLVFGTICGLATAVAAEGTVAAESSWRGFYAGVNIGGDFGSGSGSQDDWTRNGWRTSSYDGSSVIGGAQIGYNFQLSPLFILGIENDVEFSGKGSSKNGADQSKATVPLFGSGRLRAGFAPSGLNTLVYGTAGLAFGQVDNGINTRMRGGWTLGGGAEWAFLPSWSAKGEYLYTDISHSFKNDNWGNTEARFHMVRLGVNYHF
ncbi:outer membrane protein [Telmatospirillum siberiense]|uniref:Porin family protein n=1 Tax=Telmatospirillum siberiense TaxID=382514 RepID=A0A2N3PWL0_9PROT|nr:outer membrane beta-barrel protein [Telmatospirillum siberiense]PKU24802.1 porin family protein [Telmatospirillum siberiense]